MIDAIKEIQLGHEALKYVRDSLEEGKELSACLLETLVLESGSVKTFLPVESPVTDLNRFSVGGKLVAAPAEKRTLLVAGKSVEVAAAVLPNLDLLLATFINNFLNSQDNPLCIFENALAKRGDPWLNRTNVNSLYVDNSVYHLLSARDQGTELVQQTLAKAKSVRPPLIGVFTRYPLPNAPIEPIMIETAALQKIAELTESLVIGAYDGEGFLIWSK